MSFLYWTDDEGEARGQKALLATTAYDNPDASHTAAMASSRAALREAGIQTAYALLSGNCHVDDARNAIVSSFLESDCTDLVFIDADVSWTPEQLVRLCRHEVDVVAGVYPKRAAGMANMPVRMLPGCSDPAGSGLLEVEGLPTGFMRIKRHVLYSLAQRAVVYRKGHEIAEIPLIFERAYIDGVGRVGGDINFCMKARDLGFTMYADCDLRLGHAAKVIVKDSLGAALRRDRGTTLSWLAERIRSEQWHPDDFEEAIKAVNNEWGAPSEGLIAAVSILQTTPGPVIETGSGLSTIVMAAAIEASGAYVYAIEHDPVYAEITKRLALQAGVKNIGLVSAPIGESGWYDRDALAEIPVDAFALGFCDGPPRVFGSRLQFIPEGLADRCRAVIFDDVTDAAAQTAVLDYAKNQSRDIAFEGRIAIVK